MPSSSNPFAIRVFEPTNASYDGVIDSVSKLLELPSGHWGYVPDSKIRGVSGVEKLPQDYPDFDGTTSASYESYQGPAPGGSGGPHNVDGLIGAWSGGALDTNRNRLLVFGGGHSAYGGNEVYGFDIGSLSWLRLTDPFFVTAGTVPEANPNADGSPTSRHTYGGLAFNPDRDSFWAVGGARWAASSGSSKDFWELPLSGLTIPAPSPASWTQKTDAPSTLLGRTLIYSQELERFIATGNSSPQWTYLYDPATDTWTQFDPSGTGGNDLVAAIDDEMQIVRVKGDSTLTEINLNAGTVSRSVPQTGSFPGRNGYVFDTHQKRFVAFSGSATVHFTERDSHEWFPNPVANGNLVTPPPITASGGVFGRFQYVPAYNVYIYVNSASQDVYFYKF